MAKKILLLLIPLALLLSGCAVGSGSPDSTVKGFFKAINAGDFDKAENFIDGDLGDELGLSQYTYFNSVTEEELLSSLPGTIDKVEIGTKKNLDSNYVQLKAKIIPKHLAQEEAESTMERYKMFHFVKDKENKERMEAVYQKNAFLAQFLDWFSNELKFELEKGNDGWKIVYFQ